MSQRSVEILIGRLVTDEAFRRAFGARRCETLRGFHEAGNELTPVEIAAVSTTPFAVWNEVADAIDPRLQKFSRQEDIMTTGTTGNGRFFTNQTYHFETLRALGYVPWGGADTGEVLETVKLITEGDAQSWYAAWTATADRVLALAERTRDPLSKSGAYLRAHNYQRTGEFLLPPDDPKRPGSWERTLAYFDRGLDTGGIRHERIAVPYAPGKLRALYLPGSQTKPLIVIVGGFDSILEELYLVLGAGLMQRGYSVLAYEGPGQGEALRKYGLTFTPEWEKPTRAVLDEFLRTHARPTKIVLVGMSLGGYFAPRAAAFEDRIDGVVAFDTCFDFAESAGRSFAAAKNPQAASNPDVQWGYANARWTMGTTGIEDTIRAFAPYTLAPVAARIRQDVLILAGTEDHFVPLHQTADFEKALVNARSVTTQVFDRPSGGAEHCQVGNLSLVHAALADWLLAKFPAA
jgi:pimeloyl-ACP methyl ester carboxylesterase